MDRSYTVISFAVVVMTSFFVGGYIANRHGLSVAHDYSLAKLMVSLSAGEVLPVPALGAKSLLVLLLPGAVFLTSLTLHRAGRVSEKFVYNGTLALAVLVAACLLQYAAFPGYLLFSEKVAYRDSFTSVFVNRNTSATFCGMIFIVALALSRPLSLSGRIVWSRRRGARFRPGGSADWRLLVALCVSGIGLMLSNSRGGIVSTACAAVLVLVLEAGHPRDWLSRGHRGRWLLVLVVAAMLGSALFDSILFRFEVQGIDSARWCVYGAALERSADRLALGWGLGSFQWIFPSFRTIACGLYGEWEYLHGALLELLFSGGILACAVVLAVFAYIVRRLFGGYRIRVKTKAFPIAGLGVVLLVFLHSLVDFSIQIPGFAVIVASFLGAVMAFCREKTGLPAQYDS